MATLTLDPEIPAHSLDNAATWLLCWAAISVFIIIPAMHYFVVTTSQRLTGYRALSAGQQIDWNQSATMTLIMPTLLFVAFARAHWVCSGSLHSRANCYLPWTRSVWVFQAMACLYDLFVWILPKLHHGTPERVANAKLFAFHHAIVIFLDLGGLPLRRYTYYCCGIGILEGTNFFLGIYRLSQHLGISTRHPFIVVDIVCFWVSCTVFRIALPLYQLARLYLDCQIAPLMFWKNRPRIQVVLGCIAIVLYSVLTLMNFMWYYQICRKIYLAYGPASRSNAPRIKET